MKILSLKGVLLLAALLNCVPSPATQISWLEMGAQLKINSPGPACKNGRAGDRFYFSSELEANVPVAIRLQNEIQVWPFSNIYKWIDLSATDRGAFKGYRDKKGNFWIDEIQLNERLLSWILYYPSERELCRLPELAASVAPSTVVVKFDLEGIEEGVLYSQAQPINLTGELKSGKKFDVEVILTQKYQPWGHQ